MPRQRRNAQTPRRVFALRLLESELEELRLIAQTQDLPRGTLAAGVIKEFLKQSKPQQQSSRCWGLLASDG